MTDPDPRPYVIDNDPPVDPAFHQAYEMGESSGYADWEGALGEVLPDDVQALPTQVAAYIERLQEALGIDPDAMSVNVAEDTP